MGRLAADAPRRRRRRRRDLAVRRRPESACARSSRSTGRSSRCGSRRRSRSARERDVKGLYAKAFAGEITQFTGVDDPYEEPDDAEVVADTVALSPDESVALVMAELERIGVVRPADLVGAPSPPRDVSV